MHPFSCNHIFYQPPSFLKTHRILSIYVTGFTGRLASLSVMYLARQLHTRLFCIVLYFVVRTTGPHPSHAHSFASSIHTRAHRSVTFLHYFAKRLFYFTFSLICYNIESCSLTVFYLELKIHFIFK